MATVSLCMIVKNEEENLPRCLNSVIGLVDEIVITDTGSTDGTIEIAKKFTDKVYKFEWIDDFSAARNFSFSKATMQFCMWLDADDVIEPQEREKISALKESLSLDTDIVMMRYHAAVDESGQPSLTYYRERIIRRNAGFCWKGAVHETIHPAGKVVYCEAAIAHKKISVSDPERNLRIYERLISENKSLSPREKFYYGKELAERGRDEDALAVLRPFLSESGGWVENKIEACRVMSRCFGKSGNETEQLSVLLQSFCYGQPRAEICCDIGEIFFRRQDYSTAAYWYRQALACPRYDTDGGFVIPDCYGYIPSLQLCVCMYRLGDFYAAEKYNTAASKFKPDSQACIYNKSFFKNLFSQMKTEN